MGTRKRIAILGSTGSVGRSGLDVVSAHPGAFQIEMLVAGRNVDLLIEQMRLWRPAYAGIADAQALAELKSKLGIGTTSDRWEQTELVCGDDEICAAIRECGATVVLAAVVGMAGLAGVFAALDTGKDVALANKEALVAAGELVLARARAGGARIIPVDSEHSAIFQALQGSRREDLRSVVLTASGGPFLDTPHAEFSKITPARALRHPKWSMGAKISIDSATMMNKALEVIEARWLFGVSADAIEVVVHPESIIHSLIRMVDGSLLAQLSVPDMKGPVAYALGYPDGRLADVMEALDLVKLGQLTFRAVDDQRFPGINRARACLNGSNGLPAVFNAANEVAVEAFLGNSLPFTGIHQVVGEALERFNDARYSEPDELHLLCKEVTGWSRECCGSVARRSGARQSA